MNNKSLTIIITAFAVMMLLFSCRMGTTPAEPPTEAGVVINGVRWAIANVDKPGSFAQSPEDAGMFFQWNRRKGWSATEKTVSGWDSSISISTKWEAENDPCPEGWRLPTEAELHNLLNSGGTWTTRNGVNGRLFGRSPNQIFLPMVGWRTHSTGRLDGVEMLSFYWSSTQGGCNELAISLGVGLNIVDMNGSWRANGHNVRCVALTIPDIIPSHTASYPK